jgi:hypothetical protein
MGTNYYFYPKENACDHCGRGPGKPLHIGKSSYGWVFSLHIDPNSYEYPVKDLDDWIKLFPEGTIRDEYDDIVSPESIVKIITERAHPSGTLLRHDIDQYHCTGHGPGTYDYCIGTFS